MGREAGDASRFHSLCNRGSMYHGVSGEGWRKQEKGPTLREWDTPQAARCAEQEHMDQLLTRCRKCQANNDKYIWQQQTCAGGSHLAAINDIGSAHLRLRGQHRSRKHSVRLRGGRPMETSCATIQCGGVVRTPARRWALRARIWTNLCCLGSDCGSGASSWGREPVWRSSAKSTRAAKTNLQRGSRSQNSADSSHP